MAKANKGKVIQMLSPENYIRKKANTLPIFECWAVYFDPVWANSESQKIIPLRIFLF